MEQRGHISLSWVWKNLTTYGEQQPLLWKGQIQYFPNKESHCIPTDSWSWSTWICHGKKILLNFLLTQKYLRVNFEGLVTRLRKIHQVKFQTYWKITVSWCQRCIKPWLYLSWWWDPRVNFSCMVLYLEASQEILELTPLFIKSKPTKNKQLTLEFGKGCSSSSLGREKLRGGNSRYQIFFSLPVP